MRLDYRSFVGPVDEYDIIGAQQFNILISLGLRENHTLLDIGCGSLNAGRLLIPYLLPRHYFGLEPERWLIDEGIKNEIGNDLMKIKRPAFSSNGEFDFSAFGRKFDFLLAHSIFSHAPQIEILKCLLEAGKVMNKSSIFVATFYQGESDYDGKEWLYHEGVKYTLTRMKRMVKQQGLVAETTRWAHPNQQTWLLIVKPNNSVRTNDLLGYKYLEDQLDLLARKLAKIELDPYMRAAMRRRGLI